MGDILKALLALFGPMLSKLLQGWLEELFTKAAKQVDVDDDEPDINKAVAVVEKAIALTPKTRPGKRVLLRSILGSIVRESKLPKKLDESTKEEIKDAVAAAKRDL